jgi:hypothetical protein
VLLVLFVLKVPDGVEGRIRSLIDRAPHKLKKAVPP